jgi:CheY-like chemotaxis protein
MNHSPEIIIVEDNPHDAELITRVLRKYGIADKSVLLKNGAVALDFFLAEGGQPGPTPKIILLDLKLPKVDGIEVLRHLKSDERTRTIPVVVLTSSTEQRDLKAAYELGANSYVTKPIEFPEFARIIGELTKYWVELNKLPNQ